MQSCEAIINPTKRSRNTHMEREKKYKIDKLRKKNLQKLGNPLPMKQYYLDLNNELVRSAIRYFHGMAVYMGATEAQVRTISGRYHYFIVKGKGLNQNFESEKMINDGTAENLIENGSIGMVKKDRYTYRQGMEIIGVDNYRDRNLVVAEIKYDGEVYTDQDIDEELGRVIHIIDPNAVITDVTEDDAYKSINLAIKKEDEIVSE